jgi:chemotaxis response regulator CheB
MIFGMPKAAIEKGGASYILSLKDIPVFLWKLVK